MQRGRKSNSIRAELKTNHSQVSNISKQVEKNTVLVIENTQKLADIQDRSMRDNLLFTGIPENSHEDPEHTVKDILQNKLGIPGVELERVHRIGPYNSNKTNRPRTILAKFSRFKDREMVRKNANKLKGTRIGIHEQFGKETNDRRKIPTVLKSS